MASASAPFPAASSTSTFPAAIVGYFDELSTAIACGDADEALTEIASRHAMEIVGPIPESYV
jgi:hypothetical protein